MFRPNLLEAYHLANAHLLKALRILGTMGRDTPSAENFTLVAYQGR